MTVELQHPQFISGYSIKPSQVIMSSSEKETIYTEASSHDSSTNENEEYDLQNSTWIFLVENNLYRN